MKSLTHRVLGTVAFYLCTVLCSCTSLVVSSPWAAAQSRGFVRIATYNASMYRDRAGALAEDLESGSCREALGAANVLRTIRPDIVLINEIDYAPDHRPAKLFHDRYLNAIDGVGERLQYRHLYSAPVNTGVLSGLDLDGDGKTDGPKDAWGFGRYPGQYGMVIFSRFPIEPAQCRTFQRLHWADFPGALRPVDPKTNLPFHSDTVWNKLRLSSKSHWDIAVNVDGKRIHLLVSHPTPPVFDGPEDLNGCRNHDEIKFWHHYLAAADARLRDDQGRSGGLPNGEAFVIMGDLNADPVDGSGRLEAIGQLLKHPRVTDPLPSSAGAVQSASIRGGANENHKGRSDTDTAMFHPKSVGNLRIDYVLPSRNLELGERGVFWPRQEESGSQWLSATDHRLVWVDIKNQTP